MKKILSKLFAVAGTICVYLFIAAETIYLNNKHVFFDKLPLINIVMGSLSVYLFLLFFPSQAPKKTFSRLLIGIYSFITISILFVILTEASIVNFSGKGFGIEAAYHFEWQSFILGVKEYSVTLLVFVLFLFFAVKSNLQINEKIQLKYRVIMFTSALILLAIYFSSTIFSRAYSGWIEYKEATTIPLSSIDDVNKFNHLHIKASNLIKDDIKATIGNNKNSIVIYLESFSDAFTTSSQYPDLTPNINQLKEQYANLENYYASAGFTMDGLISSNCGFIPNMANGNNSMTAGAKPLFLMPCATDVLNKAGYYQEFLGGAKKRFAGKEKFLLDHSFDKVWGWEDFKEQELYKDKHSWWGLHDEDLFSLALKKIQELQKHAPYNLTLLTLSTHLKGFASPSCQKYQEGKNRYLNAIYCTDQLLGQFIDQLREKGYLNNTVVFITGDHGVFNTSVVHSIFKGKIDLQKLLGIIVDNRVTKNITQPLSSYDLGSIMLELLQIKHNVSFIYATGLDTLKEKAIFTRNNIFLNNKWINPSHECDKKNNKFIQPINNCELNKIIKSVYGFSKSFDVISGIVYNKDSKFIIKYNNDETKINDIVLKGHTLLDKIRRDGFVIEPYLLARKGVLLVLINTEKHFIINPFSFDTKASDLIKIKRLVNKFANHQFLLFSNTHPESIKFMHQLKSIHHLQCKKDNLCYSKKFDYQQLNIKTEKRKKEKGKKDK